MNQDFFHNIQQFDFQSVFKKRLSIASGNGFLQIIHLSSYANIEDYHPFGAKLCH